MGQPVQRAEATAIMGSKPSFVTDFSELPTPVPEEQAGIVTDFSKMPLPGEGADEDASAAQADFGAPSPQGPTGPNHMQQMFGAKGAAAPADATTLGPIDRLGPKLFAPNEAAEQKIYQDKISSKYGPGHQVVRDPSVSFGTSYQIFDPQGKQSGTIDPQGKGGLGEAVMDLTEAAPGFAAGAATSAAGAAGGIPLAAAVGGGIETARQGVGKALYGSDMDLKNIGLAASAELIPLVKVAGGAIKNQAKQGYGWFLGKMVKEFSEGQTGRAIKAENHEALARYFGEATKDRPSFFSPEQRIIMFNNAIKGAKTAREGIANLSDKIYKPVRDLKDTLKNNRIAQQDAYHDALATMDNALSQYPDGPEKEMLQGVRARIESAGPRKFRSPSLEGKIVPEVPVDSGYKRPLQSIQEDIHYVSQENPTVSQAISEVEQMVQKGGAPLDDIIGMKDKLNFIEKSDATGDTRAMDPTLIKAINDTRAILDNMLGDHDAEIGKVLGEYSAFREAIPFKLQEVADEKMYKPSIIGMGGVSAGAIGYAASTMNPLIILPVVGGAIGAHLGRAAASRPRVYLSMAAHAAELRNPLMQAFLTDAAKMGDQGAMQIWSQSAPDLIPEIQAALPQVFNSLLRSSPMFRSELTQDINQDGSSSIDRAKAIDELNRQSSTP